MIKILLLFTLLMSYLSAKEPLENVTLALSWKNQFQFAGYYVAKELGYYKDVGLNVKIKEYEPLDNIAEGVATQKYTFGIGHSALLNEKLDKMRKLKLLLAINQSSPLVLITRKRQDIKVLNDLQNKKISFSTQKLFDASINAMLLSAKVSLKQFNSTQTNFKITSLINADADAILGYNSNEPFLLEEKGIKYTIFDPIDYGYDFYSDFLFTSDAILQNKRQVVDAFTKATLKGWQYAYEHINESIDIILQKYNTQNKSKAALLYEAKVLKKYAFHKGVLFGNINEQKLNSIITTLRLLNLIKSQQQIDFNSFIYQPYLKEEKSQIEKKKNIFSLFIKKYETELKLFLIVIFIFLFTLLYFRYKTHNILIQKTRELNKNLEIFDKHISASKTDKHGKIISVSSAFCRATGYTEEELIGKNHRILRSDDADTKELYKDLWLTITSGHTWIGELQNKTKDGTLYWVESTISPIYDSKNSIIGYEGIRKDITQTKLLINFNKELEEKVRQKTETLQKLATTDKLTAIYNRVKIDEDLAKNFIYYQEKAEVFSVILIDIDFFKHVNDTYGHQVGDFVLQTLAQLVGKIIRSSDIFGRWGGEEFMIICPNTLLKDAILLAKKINLAVRTHSFGRVAQLTVSIGVSDIQGCQSSDKLVNRADIALYKAKESGRDRVESAKC